jgi:hypothetical protein
MAEGDLELAVRTCVKAQLKAKGFKEPYDLEGTMGGAYGYSPPLMILFHSEVQACLAKSKPPFNYQYDKTNAYITKTLAMKLREIYVEIEFRTTGPDAQAIAASDDAALAATVSVSPKALEPAKKRANRAAKPAAKAPAEKPAGKKIKKAIPTAKKAKGKPTKKSNKK